MGRAASFRLEKWYLDLVTAEGDAFIGYAADLRWGALQLRYAATLAGRAPGPFRTTTHLLGAALPEERGDEVHWQIGARGPRGVWTRRIAGPDCTLLDGADGAVRWSCRHAASAGRARATGGRELSGLGYVERLELSLPPWRLPLRELRWGRFVSEGAALAWIEWRGPAPLRLVLRDGVPAAATRVGDEVVEADGARLSFADTCTLRDGELGATVLRGVPLLRRALPPAALGTHETKWLSRGTLALAGGGRERGWAIHERVRIPAS